MTDQRRGHSSLKSALGVAAVAVALSRVLASDDPRPRRRVAEPDAPPRNATEADGREPGRGRLARTPSEIPSLGMRDVMWRVYREITADRVMSVAAGVTFYILLAIVPFITAFVSLYGLFLDPATVQSHLANIQGVVPASAMDILSEQMNRLAEKSGNALGVGFFVSLAIALWSSNAGMKAIVDALNIAYEEEETRSFVWLTIWTLMMTIGGILFLFAAIAVVVVVPIVLGFLGLGSSTELVVSIARWPILLALVAFVLAVLYRYGPDRKTARWRWVTWGSGFASVGFVIVSLGFSWYTTNFGSYDETYGSLAAVVVFMTWIWITSMVILIGAEINAELEHQTARDSTTGPPQPIGQRGAQVADTIGKAQS